MNFFAACHTASDGIEDWLGIDDVLSELAAGLSAAELRNAIRYLADDVCDDADVELLYQPNFDGIEDGTVLVDFGFANLHPRDWFEPFGYVDGPII